MITHSIDTFKKANLEITILTVDQDLNVKDYESFITLVSKEKQSRINRYHFRRDAQNTLLADVLTRYEICKRTNLKNWQLRFSTNKYGKPYLLNDPYIQYNISHSGKYIAIAIDLNPVGIDVEQIKPIDLKIARRFFTNDESEYIFSQIEEMRLIAFYQIWTKKESRIKFEGRGLSMPLSSFNVINPSTEGFSYHNIHITENDAICNVCTKQYETPSCYSLNISALLNNLLTEAFV